VQLGQFQTPDEIFGDYAYFSSFSESWIEHGRQYAKMICERFGFDQTHFVVEIASNDGYLLQHFQSKGIPLLGIEPAKNVAQCALEKGIPTLVQFFGKKTASALAKEGKTADLIIGNNVLAHVPDLNDFVGGLKLLLKPEGVITLEFPHLLQLVAHNQFDTIYHEHFSYFSLMVAEKIFLHHGLELFDVEELPTHGGSLRVYLQHRHQKHPISKRVGALKKQEQEKGYARLETYTSYSLQVKKYKERLLSFLEMLKREKKTIAGYGAPAKGNTLLNYCAITRDLLPFTVDKSPHKQGRFLPGTHIPIYAPEKIQEYRPDYLLILPWNLKTEIMHQMALIKDWSGKFVIPIPEIEVF
jgi:SAM-dependent methyltransferase